MSEELDDVKLRAAILEFLVKKGRWGAHYFPLDTLVNWLGKKVRRDGKRVLRTVKQLVGEGHLVIHKRGETVSLNSAKSKDIVDYLRRVKEGSATD